MKKRNAVLAGLMVILITGCSAGDDAGGINESVRAAEDELTCGNALNLNALNLNALNLNALNLNALDAASLTSLRRSDSQGELARQLLKYTVSCALDATQSVELTWTDSLGDPRLDTYWGLMGLAPSWADTPLSDSGQRWISACLASRANWYGVPVLLSSRGPHGALSYADPSEVSDFPVTEGAFWGNIFGPSPQAHACHDATTISHSRQKMRDCAAGHAQGGSVVNCGLIDIVGPCQARCAPRAGADTYFQSCSAAPGESGNAEVITVWLPL